MITGNNSLLQSARLAVQIDDVDIAHRSVHVIDNKNGRFQAFWTMTPTGFQIPQQGDVWTILRHGHEWHLENRFDTPEENATKNLLSPGDVHIRTPGNILFDAAALTVGSGQIAATTRDTAVMTGSTASYTLSGTPVHEYTIMVYVNGALLHPVSEWKLTGANVITFTSHLSLDDKLTVYYQRMGSEHQEAGASSVFSLVGDSVDYYYKDIITITLGISVTAIESR